MGREIVQGAKEALAAMKRDKAAGRMHVKTGRNDPCPCGSKRKYKVCCLAKDEATEREAVEIAARRAEEPLVTGRASAFDHAINRVRSYKPNKLRQRSARKP